MLHFCNFTKAQAKDAERELNNPSWKWQKTNIFVKIILFLNFYESFVECLAPENFRRVCTVVGRLHWNYRARQTSHRIKTTRDVKLFWSRDEEFNSLAVFLVCFETRSVFHRREFRNEPAASNTLWITMTFSSACSITFKQPLKLYITCSIFINFFELWKIVLGICSASFLSSQISQENKNKVF